MSDPFGMFVVFFFEEDTAANLFLRTGDIELSIARKLLQVPQGADITADYISADTGIVSSVMVVYPLCEVEPVVLTVTGKGRVDSAS